jgi:general secretion pathway protein C
MAGKWLSRIVTFAVWTLVAISVTWWSLKFVGARATTTTAAALSVPAPGSDPADLAKVFGPPIAASEAAMAAAPAAIDPGTRFALIGVVADRASSGVAIISVDGKAARPYRVGSQIEESYKLKSVATRSAVLEPSAPAGAPFTLELTTVVGAVRPGASLPPAILSPPILPPIPDTSSGPLRPLRPAR